MGDTMLSDSAEFAAEDKASIRSIALGVAVGIRAVLMDFQAESSIRSSHSPQIRCTSGCAYLVFRTIQIRVTQTGQGRGLNVPHREA
jgi:hypothetical protein